MSEMPAVRSGLTHGQLALFSPRPRVKNAREGAETAYALSRPARTFTGDFFFTHRHDSRLWFAVGDVAGKGLPAAVFMAMIQEELEHRITACAATECDPSRTMQRLDAFLRPLMPRNRFATVIIGNLRDDGLLTIANAGHPPLLVVRTGGEIEELSSSGPATGIVPGASWTLRQTRLEPGDTVIGYSDGVIESTHGDEEIGVGGLRRIARVAARQRKLADVAAGIVAGLGEVSDDLTVLVLRQA